MSGEALGEGVAEGSGVPSSVVVGVAGWPGGGSIQDGYGLVDNNGVVLVGGAASLAGRDRDGD
jgi:hypothetical protein